MKYLLVFLSLILISTSSFAFKLSDFGAPESIALDPQDGSYYVSNVQGLPSNKDGNGYISKISPNGNTVILKFIGDKKEELLLNAPKGLLVLGKDIFVTDIDSVKAFNKETGKPSVIVDMAGFNVQFLNDIAMDEEGTIYVSDTMTNQIFKMNPKDNFRVTIFKQGPELGGPNGLAVNPKSKNLIVATFGTGQILEINRRSGKILTLKKGLNGLDGVDYDSEGNLYVSSFEKGEIYKIAYYGRGSLTTFASGLITPADIHCDRKKKEILVPSFDGNTVTMLPISSNSEK